MNLNRIFCKWVEYPIAIMGLADTSGHSLFLLWYKKFKVYGDFLVLFCPIGEKGQKHTLLCFLYIWFDVKVGAVEKQSHLFWVWIIWKMILIYMRKTNSKLLFTHLISLRNYRWVSSLILQVIKLFWLIVSKLYQIKTESFPNQKSAVIKIYLQKWKTNKQLPTLICPKMNIKPNMYWL